MTMKELNGAVCDLVKEAVKASGLQPVEALRAE